MPVDRYEQNRMLFIIGILCLIVSLSLITFSLYILPTMLWSWLYSTPEFLFIWRENLTETYGYTETSSGLIVFLIFFLPGAFAGLLSVLISNRIDKQALGLIVKEEDTSEPQSRVSQEIKESFGFGAKIFLLSLGVILAVWLLNWLLSTNPAPGY